MQHILIDICINESCSRFKDEIEVLRRYWFGNTLDLPSNPLHNHSSILAAIGTADKLKEQLLLFSQESEDATSVAGAFQYNLD